VEEAILSKATVDIPKVMIERKQEELLNRFAERLADAGVSVDAYLRSSGRTAQQVYQDFEPDAQREVKRELVLDEVASRENIQVSEEALDSVIQAFAHQTGKDPQAVKTTLELRGVLDGIKRDILRAETLKKLVIEAAQRAGTPLPEEAPPAPAVTESAAPAPESAVPGSSDAIIEEGETKAAETPEPPKHS